jgi:membrane fusion protein, type I secretion system
MSELTPPVPRPFALKERDVAFPLPPSLRRSQQGPVRDDPTGAIFVGLVVIILFFGVLGTWAAVAHISSAVVAPGRVKVEGNLRSVQHHYGGTIRRILVKDGDRVEQGQVLLTLDDTAARAKLESLTAVRVSLKALEARLIAERDSADKPNFDVSLTALHGRDLSDAMANQLSLFRTRAQQLNRHFAPENRAVASANGRRARSGAIGRAPARPNHGRT